MNPSIENVQKIQENIKNKRKDLDAGKITVDDYLKTVQPNLIEGLKQGAIVGGQKGMGSFALDLNQKLQDAAGMTQDMSQPGVYKVNPSGDFSTKYQQQIRESLLPQGLTPEQRNAYIKDIPQDIEYGSDQYKVEKEGLRQKLQSEATAATQKTQRASQLTDLAGLLSSQADTNFQRSIPIIGENANTGGIFRSTGYGNALAQQEKQLQEDVASKVSQQGLQDRALDTGSLSDILAASQGFQTSGMQRTFSLADFNNQTNAALKMAQAAQPQQQGKTSQQRNMAYAQLGLGAAGIGAKGASAGKTGGAGVA